MDQLNVTAGQLAELLSVVAKHVDIEFLTCGKCGDAKQVLVNSEPVVDSIECSC